MRTRIHYEGHADGVAAVIGAVAGRQGGRVARRQLLDAGIHRDAIARRVRAGLLIPEWPGVYRVGHTAETNDGRWWGALLLGGEESGLSHRSGAEARGLLPVSSALIHVTTPRQIAGRAHLRFHRGRPEVERVDGLPVVSVGEVLVGLGRGGRRREVERALDEAAARGVLDLGELPDRLPRLLRAALEDHHLGSTITRSELEERFLALVDRHGLPRPQANQDLVLPDGSHVNVDMLWRRRRVAVELQSWRHHRTRFEADHAKRTRLELAGYAAPAYTWRMVVREEGLVAASLRRALTRP